MIILRSQHGSSILENAMTIYMGDDRDRALRAKELAESLYPDFKVVMLDLGNLSEKVWAVDVDPDIAGKEAKYAVIFQVPNSLED